MTSVACAQPVARQYSESCSEVGVQTNSGDADVGAMYDGCGFDHPRDGRPQEIDLQPRLRARPVVFDMASVHSDDGDASATIANLVARVEALESMSVQDGRDPAARSHMVEQFIDIDKPLCDHPSTANRPARWCDVADSADSSPESSESCDIDCVCCSCCSCRCAEGATF